MRRWLALALQLLGLAAAAVAVWRGAWWAGLAALAGVSVTLGWTIRWRPGRLRRRGPPALSHRDILDLVRRVYGAPGAWLVGPVDGGVEIAADTIRDGGRRGAALVQLSSVDGRVHVLREMDGTYVAVGDFPYGAGLLLAAAASDDATTAAAGELRRLIAGIRLSEEHGEGRRGAAQILARRVAGMGAGTQTLDGIARAGVELAEQVAQRGAVLAVTMGDATRVVAVSPVADRRLANLLLPPEAPLVRSIASGVPLVTRSGEDPFGPGAPERRRGDRGGSIYPLLDGSRAIAALVLLGPPLDPDTAAAEELGPLITELGPRLAAAKAVFEAEQRAVVDPLTGLRNRREFERVIKSHPPGAPATLVYVDLDHFKKLNDTLGHAAGDAALKHISRLLEDAVRDGDLVARIGGEEFAVWLPRAPQTEGLEVAERIRAAVADSVWRWSGERYPLTTSCGVATFPQPIGDLMNLPAAADAALYRAKQEGRNRVEKAVRTR